MLLKPCVNINQLMEESWMWESVCVSQYINECVLKWQVRISPVSTAREFSPVGSIKNHVAVTYAYEPGSTVFLSLSDLQAPHLHCLQWSMWSHIHSCHVIAWLCFCYNFAGQNVHSFPSNFLSKTSVVLFTRIITGAQRQLGSFNHRENILALHVCVGSRR